LPLHNAIEEVARPGEGIFGPDYPSALAAMNKAKSDAWAADDALFDAINRELAWKPASTNTTGAKQ
jgi:hypothetical protein